MWITERVASIDLVPQLSNKHVIIGLFFLGNNDNPNTAGVMGSVTGMRVGIAYMR